MNPYSSSGMYMTDVKDAEFRVVAEIRCKQDEACKENTKKAPA